MRIDPQTAWTRANQAYLMAAIRRVRDRITPGTSTEAALDEAEEAGTMYPPPALDQLTELFHLSWFERAVILACAGVELDAQFARTCSDGAPSSIGSPTFGWLLASLDDAHWDAVSPAGPLRRWRLIDMAAGPTLMSSPLRLDERILHFLTGTSYIDQRLDGLVEPVASPADLPDSQFAVAQRGAEMWAPSAGATGPIAIELNGADQHTRRSVAVCAARLAGHPVLRLPIAALPAAYGENHSLARLVDRECILASTAVLIEATAEDGGDAARRQALHLFADSLHSPLIISAPHRIGGHLRPTAYLEVAKPLTEEQRTEWRSSLGASAASLNGHLDDLVEQFNLSGEQIRLSSLHAAPSLSADQTSEALWNACRGHARPELDSLAQRVVTSAGWDSLVLPEPQMDLLRAVATQMRNRTRVYKSWGFAAHTARGLGITALFTGASGTGKTTAAEVLAHELKLDLYRIDLSQVVSKYIGETEKGLRRIFDAAEEGGSLLLFDEADALFGKRTEVKDSHDRYANIEVSYLLQRMEQYRGLAVLATNMKQALDSAFLRRIRFVVQFPFPDATLREQIWRRALPREAPTEGVDYKQLARLCVAGGNICNIAFGAAFLAAESGEPIRMCHLLQAARAEYLKIEKPLTEAEIRGWVS